MIILAICDESTLSVKVKRLKARYCSGGTPTVFEVTLKKTTNTDPIGLSIEIPTPDIIRMAEQAGYTVTKKGS